MKNNKFLWVVYVVRAGLDNYEIEGIYSKKSDAEEFKEAVIKESDVLDAAIAEETFKCIANNIYKQRLGVAQIPGMATGGVIAKNENKGMPELILEGEFEPNEALEKKYGKEFLTKINNGYSPKR